MAMEEVMKSMLEMGLGGNMLETAKRVRETPSKANETQFPEVLRNPAITLTATVPMTARTPTLIMAIEVMGYTEQNFQHDVEKASKFFGFNQNDESQVTKLLFKAVDEGKRVIDSADASAQMRKAVSLMNRSYVTELSEMHDSGLVSAKVQPSGTLRIVSLGIAKNAQVFKALEYLLNEWKSPTKSLQFVIDSDTDSCEFMKFWVDAVSTELCKTVQFVQLDSYLPYGYYEGKKCRKLIQGSGQYTSFPPT